MQWETVTSTPGGFIGWGNTEGQHVTGKVLDYSPDGGTDFNGNRCPQISIELTEPAASFNKHGERTDYAAGETVTLTCGQKSLHQAMLRAAPAPGDLIKVVLTGLAKTQNGAAKVFEIKIARGAAGSAAPAAPTQQPVGQQASFGAADDAPPF